MKEYRLRCVLPHEETLVRAILGLKVDGGVAGVVMLTWPESTWLRTDMMFEINQALVEDGRTWKAAIRPSDFATDGKRV